MAPNHLDSEELPLSPPGSETAGSPSACETPSGADLRAVVVGAGATLADRLRRWAGECGAALSAASEIPAPDAGDDAGTWDLALLVLPEAPGEELLRRAGALADDGGKRQVVLLTPRPSLGLALAAARSGAADLLPLPLERGEFVRMLGRTRTAKANGAIRLRAPEEPPPEYADLVGRSPPMLEVYKQIALVAPTTATVLVAGESGTGKEVVARAIHANGPRRDRPFVAVNCAAIPENLLESELFGHEKGSFTGALSRRVGQFERAAGGTLLLDEIADMGAPLQAKILRAVQERTIQRVGGGEPIPVDVRVIAATNRDLRAEIEAKRFREDLYFRLAVVTIRLPALRDRQADLDLLVSHYLAAFADRHGKRITSLSERARDLLWRHPWPGNVRELGNVLERAVIVARGSTVRAEDLPEDLRRDGAPGTGGAETGLLPLAEVEARHVRRVLASTGGRIEAAARILGIHRNTLARKMRDLGI